MYLFITVPLIIRNITKDTLISIRKGLISFPGTGGLLSIVWLNLFVAPSQTESVLY